MLALASVARHRLWVAGEQAVYLWHQHQCMHWHLPGDALVYDDDPDSAARLLKQTSTFRPPMHLAFDRGFPLAGWVPPATRYFPPFDAMESAFEAGGYSVPLYMHGTAPDSQSGEKLVVVLAGTCPFGKKEHALGFAGFIYAPADLHFGSRAVKMRSGYRSYFATLNAIDQFQLYAGQPAGNDPGHFSIPYQLNGTSGTITGRLLPPGAWHPSFDKSLQVPSVELEVTRGPLKWDSPSGE